MKKGFTLVEIMVVVVIMGVLAAVGVPKLFGVIAKARAAEVPVAAGTYVSLQNAFLHENNGVGGWDNIGYGAPGDSEGKTEYFEYSGCIKGNIPFENMEPDMPGWQASNRSKLNYCGAGSAWAVVIDPAGEREIEYRRLISSAECEALTVNWGSVGSTVEGMCEATGELHVAEKDDDEPDTPQEPSESSEENPTTPTPSTPPPQENTSTQSEQQQQGDCDALAASIKNDNGNKYGWICVSECGMFAPPGKARNAGFTVEKSQKKKATGGTCKKVEPESNAGNNDANEGSGGSTSDSEEQSTQQGSNGGSQSTGGATTSTDGENGTGGDYSGYKGDGEPHEYNADNDVCLKYNEADASKCEEWDDKAGYEGYVGDATPHKYDEDKDICLKQTSESCEEWDDKAGYEGYKGHGTPHKYNESVDYCLTESNGCTTWRPNSECKKWSKKNCNNSGTGSVQEKDRNKTSCGSCTDWNKK